MIAASLPALAGEGDGDDDAPARTLGTVTVTATRPTSLPMNIPTTIEGITGDEIAETINATNALATYRVGDRWTASLGARYSGTHYNTLDNSDTNAFSFTGTSQFLVFDTRVRCRVGERWIASLGIDNLANEEYWAFHPYSARLRRN